MFSRILVNRWVHLIMLFALLISAVYYSGSNARWRSDMRHVVFDELNRQYPRVPNSEENKVVIVNVDDDSLYRLGQWPWPRTKIAELIKALNEMGAKAVVFDGVLAEDDRTSPQLIAKVLEGHPGFQGHFDNIESLPNNDQILAKTIKEADNFVAAFTWGSYAQGQKHGKPRIKQRLLAKKAEKTAFLSSVPRFNSTANFLPVLENASRGNGSFMALPDYDGVLRRAGLIFTDGKKLYPSLSLEAVRVGEGKPWSSMIIAPAENDKGGVKALDTSYRIKFKDYNIPVESNALLYVYYRVFDESGDDYVSAYKIITPDFRNEVEPLIKDKIVMIGASAEGLKDLRSTAIEAFQPGVEIHANVVEQILQGEYLLRPDITIGAEAMFIFFAGTLMIILAPFVSVSALLVLCVSLMVAALAGSMRAYTQYNLLLDPFYPSLSVFAIFIVSVLLTYLRVEYERRQVRSAFGLYISPDFMQELTKNPDKLRLGGEIRDLTVLFSDIRSFTTISEGLTPRALIQLMNDFLTPMSDVVMQNRGTIDKYMGDAMMAFWNAPLDDAQHARNACNAALQMQKALEKVNDAIKEKALKEGKEPLLLSAGIGINTGPCAVGNMGSKQRFAYSALGDTVNLASRLEGQTKNYGVEVLIGEQTWKSVPDMATLEADLIKVKGKDNAERIFVLLGGEEIAGQVAFHELKQLHEKMINAYREKRFDQALALIAECRQKSDYNLSQLYDVYEERIKELLSQDLDDNWDGVYVATSK